ncbi:MAG: hypothetical protein C0490_12655 [Marivirga sp.]|nr:hypothetical protein [Marivirga sp.]
MKTKSLYLAALMVIAAIVTAVGKDEPGSQGLAVVPVKGSEVFKIIYKGESSSKVKLSIYNSSSEVVFSETMNGVNGFIRPLNFTGLQFGEYTVELTDASGKKVEKINYQPTKSESSVHVSKLISGEGKFLLSVAKANSQTITVKIFDEANNLVHTNTKEVSGDFAQLYTLKDVAGAVTFEVSDNSGNIKTVRF